MTQDRIDSSKLQRKKPPVEAEDTKGEVKVSQGAIDRIVDLVGNPSRDKIREVTSITAMQGKLLPQLDIYDLMWQHYIEVAMYRYDPELYKATYERDMPIFPNIVEEFMYRTAQWQKSVQAMNLKSMMDLALAETEARGAQDEFTGNFDPYGKD